MEMGTYCYALCQIFRLGDTFLYTVVLIRLCKNKFYLFCSAKQPRSLKRKKDISLTDTTECTETFATVILLKYL